MGLIFKAILGCVLTMWVTSMATVAEKMVMDVAFLIDSSGSLGAHNFKRELQAVSNMAKFFEVSPLGTHAAAIVYSDKSEVPLTFNQFFTYDDFNSVLLERARFMQGRSRMENALRNAIDNVFSAKGNTRDFVPKIAIIITDGKLEESRNLPLVQKLRTLEVTTYMIGVGNGVQRRDLHMMAAYDMKRVFEPNSFQQLLSQSTDIASRIYSMEEAAFKATENGKDPCKHPIDLAIVVHAPEELNDVKFNRLKQYISGISIAAGIDGGRSRAALIYYNNNATVKLNLEAGYTKEKFDKALGELQTDSGDNRMDLALKAVNNEVFSRRTRSTVSRIAVVFTFEKQSNRLNKVASKMVAAQLKAREIKVFVIGIGIENDIKELEGIVTKPTQLTMLKNIKALNGLVLGLASKICEESVPTARSLVAVAKSHVEIFVKWETPLDPDRLITGYQLTWKVIESSRGENIINARRESVLLPPEANSTNIDDLISYTLYLIELIPKWQDGIQGDVSVTEARTLPNVNECLTNPCDENAECTNTRRSYYCTCKTGFGGDGFRCSDIDECPTSPCHHDATCTNIPGSYQCECNRGYSGDGFNCQDDDECPRNPCDTNAKCTNNPGSYSCICNTGYTGDGNTCSDINECPKNPCSANAACTNTDGSYKCECNFGYSGNGFSCTDNNECETNPCNDNALCFNTPGSYTCECNVGYSGNGFECSDVDECLSSKGSPCDANARCYNTIGSYYCECNTGFNGNGKVCSVVNICSYPMDLAVAIDTSDSISKEQFETQKAAIVMLARSFGLSKLGTHVAVIVYGSEAQVAIKLGDFFTLDEFSKAVRGIEYGGGNTRIDKAMGVATNDVFSSNDARGGMPKMFIIMTDGQQTSAPDAVPLTQGVAPLRGAGVKVVTIAIGKEVDPYELIAISESKENIYHVLSFDTLFETVTNVGQSLCQKAKKDCSTHADIAILVDSSASMRGGNYVKEKALVKAIAREFDVSLYGSHVSLVLYNTDSEVVTGFQNEITLKEFEMVVDKLPLKGGKIRLDKALRLVASDVFTKEGGMREDIPQILFILTDGTQNRKCEEEALELAIAPLRSQGIHIVAIGVGEADERELRPLVKSPANLFIGQDFDEVTEPVMEFIKGFCKNFDQSCSTSTQLVDINVDGCKSESSVEVAVCDGKCYSGTRYIADSRFSYESRCTCCVPTVIASKNVQLICSNGTSSLHRISEASECHCRSCSGAMNAPPVFKTMKKPEVS